MVNQSLLDDFDELFPQEKVKWDDVVIKDKLGEGGQRLYLSVNIITVIML